MKTGMNESPQQRSYSLTVIVAAYNEAEHLEPMIRSLELALQPRFPDREVLIFDDGSVDGTGEIAERLAGEFPDITVIRNGSNMGLGYNYNEGVRRASKEYVILLPGDDELDPDSYPHIFDAIGDTDMVIPYTANPGVRPWYRRLISRAYVLTLNIFFGLDVRYYNGQVVHRRSIIQKVPMRTFSFAYQSSILVRLLRTGHSYRQVKMYIRPQSGRKSRAFSLNNIVQVMRTCLWLTWEVRVRHRRRYNRPVRIEGPLPPDTTPGGEQWP